MIEHIHDELPTTPRVDGSSRGTPDSRENVPEYCDLIHTFGEKAGSPDVLVTSTNRRGRPIVDAPSDAVDRFPGANTGHTYFPDTTTSIGESEE